MTVRALTQRTQFLVITGLSGSGKSLVQNCFEDMGYYCVDNLPISLMGKFFELIQDTGEIARVAVVTDVREKSFLTDFVRAYSELKARFEVRLLFLEASDEALLRRFSETRRPHPLAHEIPLAEALRIEREKLLPVRELADAVIDTTRFNVHEVREHVRNTFGAESPAGSLVVSVMSFGYKHGVPREADLVFDVRFLPNPHFVAEFRGRTGLDPAVSEWVLGSAQTRETLARLIDFLRWLVPLYVREGKAYLTIAVGCTGGRHRSVVIAQELAGALKDARHAIHVVHRDLERS